MATLPMIKLNNTLSRKKELFDSLHEGEVRIYSCGPTVYWFCHIGNLRSFIFSDVLHRVFLYHRYRVTLIMNITDVGHLVGDGDEGEDKMIVAMKREGKSAYDISEFYAQHFFSDCKKVGILPATMYPRATAHIEEQIDLIRRIEYNGFTYITSDGVYFDTSKLTDYGKLSGQRNEEKLGGARVTLGEKKNQTDFALWKFSPKNMQSREMEWDSPWGVGFPGWHIECSAMSKKYLGIPFDIHTGGIDHIPVHHENELAQTQGADGELEARVWLHNEFVTVDGVKMSKSLQNVYTLDDIIQKGFHPLAFRYFCLTAHYRQILNFTWDALDGAQRGLFHLYEEVLGCKEKIDGTHAENSTACASVLELITNTTILFDAALDDDLNISQGLAVLFDALRNFKLLTNLQVEDYQKFYEFLLLCDRVLGLGFDAVAFEKIPQDIQDKSELRKKQKLKKNWEYADEIRTDLIKLGYRVEDTDDGDVHISKIVIDS